jgi:hypothetical protein
MTVVQEIVFSCVSVIKIYNTKYLRKLFVFFHVITIWKDRYYALLSHKRSQGSSDNTVTLLSAGRPVFDSRQGKGFLLATTSELALGSTQPPIK